MELSSILSIVTMVVVVVGLAVLYTRDNSAQIRGEMTQLRNDLVRQLGENQGQLDTRFEQLRESVSRASVQQRDEANASRKEVQDALLKMQEGNEKKLEEMRLTVDEKLQGTLERRLGESFKLVSDRLEAVQKGLGEMQGLATGVGDLKRVLTNVKSRGTWGEVQLARQLEDMLAPNQYEANVKTKRNSNAQVEFAIKYPGQVEGELVYLPIDSKFPQEDYERLVLAQEAGDPAAIAESTKALLRAIKLQAKTIQEKYIDVPHTTDFAIMYLPTEGLFAEVIRQPGLASELQNSYRIGVAGPTTLSALLSSLQMGFRTLAIEKSASEVWQVLAAAKVEFTKYGQVWDRLQKQLATAQNTVADAKTRTTAIERKLRNVEVASFAPLEVAPHDGAGGEIAEPAGEDQQDW